MDLNKYSQCIYNKLRDFSAIANIVETEKRSGQRKRKKGCERAR